MYVKNYVLTPKNIAENIYVEKTYYIRKVGGGGGSGRAPKKKSECWSLFHVPPPPCFQSTCLSSVRFDSYIIDPVPVAVVQSGLSTTPSPTSAINVIDVYIRLDGCGRAFTVTRHCFRVAPCQHEICSVLCSLRTSSRMVGRGYL